MYSFKFFKSIEKVVCGFDIMPSRAHVLLIIHGRTATDGKI